MDEYCTKAIREGIEAKISNFLEGNENEEKEDIENGNEAAAEETVRTIAASRKIEKEITGAIYA